MQKSEYAQIVANRDPALIEKREARAHILMNALVWASVQRFGEDHLSNWRGDLTIDGTPLKISRNGRYDSSHLEPSDPDTSWHIRDQDGSHQGPRSMAGQSLTKQEQSSGKRSEYAGKRSEYAWAHELTVSSMWGGGFGEGIYPSLVAGVSFDKPSARVGENTMRSIDHTLDDPSIPRGTVVTDRAYFPHARPEKFAIPLRQAGYKLLGDYRRGDNEPYGILDTQDGAVMVDGTWFSPAIVGNDRFINTRKRRDTGELTQEEYEEIVQLRAPYALKIKEVTKNGNVRLECPSRGTCPSVTCKLAKKVPSKRKDVRKRPKALLPISVKQLPNKIDQGKICS